jgi:hypothetical protein
MWWAVCLLSGKQAIQDRWCAVCFSVSVLNKDKPTQMAIPLPKNERVSQQLVAEMWRVPEQCAKHGSKIHFEGVNLESQSQ